jgi:hypothetical protein
MPLVSCECAQVRDHFGDKLAEANLAQNDRPIPVEADKVERVFADVDANCCNGFKATGVAWHGMLLILVARASFAAGWGRSTAGPSHYQLFTWRRLVTQGSLTAAGSGEEVVPASNYRALQNQVRELRLLCKKTLEAEILKEPLEHAAGSKKQLRLPLSPPKDGRGRRGTECEIPAVPM